MKSTLFANSAEIHSSGHSALARAALQAAWVSIAVLIVIRRLDGWNFDTTLNALSPPCLFHVLTGMDCPGCGMTRAFLRLANGDIKGAWDLHPFSPFLAVLLLGLAWGPKTLWLSIQHSAIGQRLTTVALILLLSWWLWAKVLFR